ncbi:autotransporter outer membrane beta-barrel domain-containing protein [Variovorax paradoxus]|uniref:autotransporter outer membrane beta-barrel domain-containing protein n=1 Tax=Variovorax paradoxus TaxID=34073 RepID=UPI001F5FD0A4|nr:autotransporter outer membrane beta-barrel domain-containing protein [Variovorax paradoxus]
MPTSFGNNEKALKSRRLRAFSFAWRCPTSSVKSDAFLERGGLAALYVDGGSVDTTFSTLGVRSSTQLGSTTRVRGMLGWCHAFGDTAPISTHAFAGSIPFTLAGVPLARNVAGVDMQLRPNLTLGAS